MSERPGSGYLDPSCLDFPLLAGGRQRAGMTLKSKMKARWEVIMINHSNIVPNNPRVHGGQAQREEEEHGREGEQEGASNSRTLLEGTV